MEVTIDHTEHATILSLRGRLDSNTAPRFEEQLQEYLRQPTSHLVFDFAKLEYISSAGLRVILNTAKAYSPGPYRFAACAMQEHVQEVFEIAGFDSFIAIFRSIEESLASLDTTWFPS